MDLVMTRVRFLYQSKQPYFLFQAEKTELFSFSCDPGVLKRLRTPDENKKLLFCFFVCTEEGDIKMFTRMLLLLHEISLKSVGGTFTTFFMLRIFLW